MLIISEVINEVEKALEDAEKIWGKVETQLSEKSMAYATGGKIDTDIPGYKIIHEGKPKVGKFIAFVLDIRNSSDHLNVAISQKTAKASQLQRVLYETTAINTVGAIVIDHYSGGITEFLGDGFLALFNADNNSKVYKAHNAAKKILYKILPELNQLLYERYSLPELKLGIGMAYSKAIVTVVGHGENKHPKAIGENVFRASKLSYGVNKILIDDRLKYFWPSSDDGKLKFNQILNNDIKFNAYKIS